MILSKEKLAKFKEHISVEYECLCCKHCKFWTSNRDLIGLLSRGQKVSCPNCDASTLECSHSGPILKGGYTFCVNCLELIYSAEDKHVYELLQKFNPIGCERDFLELNFDSDDLFQFFEKIECKISKSRILCNKSN